MSTSQMFHLLPLEAYRAAGDSPIDAPSLEHEGFVHCSPDPGTTLAVANGLYREAEGEMVVLELDPAALSAPVRWEAPAPAPPPGVAPEVLFPHVYGPLEQAAVRGVRYARRHVDGGYAGFEERGATAERLDLLPHPEGGWYRRTWVSPAEADPGDREGKRPAATAIYFLLPAGKSSQWHTVASDELWLWHSGAELALQLGGDGARPWDRPSTVRLGPGPEDGQQPQARVPAGTWQRAEPGGAHGTETLVTCVVSPGFDFADFHTL